MRYQRPQPVQVEVVLHELSVYLLIAPAVGIHRLASVSTRGEARRQAAELLPRDFAVSAARSSSGRVLHAGVIRHSDIPRRGTRAPFENRTTRSRSILHRLRLLYTATSGPTPTTHHPMCPARRRVTQAVSAETTDGGSQNRTAPAPEGIKRSTGCGSLCRPRARGQPARTQRNTTTPAF